MARTIPTNAQARQFAALIAEFEPRVWRAFMAAVTDLQAHVDWKALLAALEAGDIDTAITALNISEAAFSEYSAVMSEAYAKAGASTAAQIRQSGLGGVGVRFNLDNPRATEWIAQNVGQQITRITTEQESAVRDVIARGYSQGAHPHTIARDIAGPSGGILGLDLPRAERLQNVREGMRTPEGVQWLMEGDKCRYKVNKATENRIRRALSKGEAVPLKEQEISARQYHNALLQARTQTIAQTETANAVMSARDDEWRQFLEHENIPAERITKTWRHGRGATKYHRPEHLAMAGTVVSGIDAPFVFPDGTEMLYPHDPNGGAEHLINCGCSVDYRIDHAAGLA